MARFSNIPPALGVPRNSENVPEEVQIPTLDVEPSTNIPENAGPPAGIPMIPSVVCEHAPEAAEDALDCGDFFL